MTNSNDVVPFSKKTLGEYFNLSAKLLGEYMNHHYFEELSSVGYRINMKDLPPSVVRKFIEIHGKPITKDEL